MAMANTALPIVSRLLQHQAFKKERAVSTRVSGATTIINNSRQYLVLVWGLVLYYIHMNVVKNR